MLNIRVTLRRASIFIALLLSLSVDVHSAPSLLTDEEILRAETLSDSSFMPADLPRVVALNYPLQYVFQAMALEVDPSKLSSERGDIFKAGAGVSDLANLARASQIGWSSAINDPKSATFVKASIAFELLGSVFGGKSDRDLMKERWQELQSPSLYLVAIRKKLPMDSITAQLPSAVASAPGNDKSVEVKELAKSLISERFTEAVILLDKFGLSCESAHTKSKNIFGSYITRGYYVPGKLHERFFLCGRDGESNIGAALTRVESRLVSVQSISKSKIPNGFDDGTFSFINLSRIDQMKSALAVARMPEGMDPEAWPRHLYERVREHLTDDWSAVFTTKTADGRRLVVVARVGHENVFEIPMKPS